MQDVPRHLERWLRCFARAVRERDFAAGKKLFDDGVTSFGTVCFRMENLEELAAHQWGIVWSRTADFDFEYATARAALDEKLAAVIAEWRSTGFDAAQKPFPRRGRATIVLRKTLPGWRAIHTHFSIEPTAADIHGPILRHPRA